MKISPIVGVVVLGIGVITYIARHVFITLLGMPRNSYSVLIVAVCLMIIGAGLASRLPWRLIGEAAKKIQNVLFVSNTIISLLFVVNELLLLTVFGSSSAIMNSPVLTVVFPFVTATYFLATPVLSTMSLLGRGTPKYMKIVAGLYSLIWLIHIYWWFFLTEC